MNSVCNLQMVALHKEHYVFPVTLGVTRVSGTGAEAMFMGVMRPALEDAGAVKAWIMPGEHHISIFGGRKFNRITCCVTSSWCEI